MPSFVSKIKSVCYSSYSLQLECRQDSSPIATPSFLTTSSSLLTLHPTAQSDAIIFNLTLLIDYSDESISRSAIVTVATSQFLSFSTPLPVVTIERSFLTESNTYRLPEVLNPNFLEYDIQLMDPPEFAKFEDG